MLHYNSKYSIKMHITRSNTIIPYNSHYSLKFTLLLTKFTLLPQNSHSSNKVYITPLNSHYCYKIYVTLTKFTLLYQNLHYSLSKRQNVLWINLSVMKNHEDPRIPHIINAWITPLPVPPPPAPAGARSYRGPPACTSRSAPCRGRPCGAPEGPQGRTLLC